MKRLIRYIVLIVLTTLLAMGISWSAGKAEREVCTAIDVEVLNADSTSFVTPQGILSEMNRMGLKAVGMPVGKINTDFIESKLMESAYLESAECVLTANNHLVIRVKQIIPVLRVFDGNTSYYMNREGKHMASSTSFIADVPVVQGKFTQDFPATRLLPLVEYINSDPTLKELVTMISVRDSNNVFIVPAFSGHVVNMGPPTGFESKFKRLTAFYKNVLPYKGYSYYDTISVKWDHQVVGTKRTKKVKEEFVPDTTSLNDDDGPDLQTLQGDGTVN